MTMDFGNAFLQIQYLTHTSVQLYSRSQWENSVCKVDKEMRGFKVGMALEFKDYIIAFPTIDMVFQPTLAHTRKELPPPHWMVLEDLLGFLDRLTKWIAQRKDGRSK
ncbi:hypothetical protein PILCRDRAFT_8682 [Piloderma croceum F 1598]|uniref:Uncharacterized protein n=1 Tax=Piloderma croceum (strain F 1598) TaxID=765440 RepID=A0A0C3BWD3_PILCF|nr:hypothetical protein PILCRDRAFT_8682 [Piloderma croceum F 1598]